MLESKLESLYENSKDYIKTQTETLVKQYLMAMLNHKLNYYIAEFVKKNLETMIDGVWEKQFHKKNVLRKIDEEIESSFYGHLDKHATVIFNKYLHEELKKKAKAVAKKMEV